jgi:prepilin-type N-terminal cleavage/methylation domain-containing protein
MDRSTSIRGRGGFTLIEILVSLILLAVLAAAVFPVVTQQIGAADAPALANDLSAVKTALDTYNANTGTFAGDVEDLVYKPAATEHTILAATYTTKELRGWNGPYLEVFMQDGTATLNTDDIANGFGFMENPLVCVDSDVSPEADPVALACVKNSGHFVSVHLSAFTVEEFLKLNDIVDLSEEGAGFTETQRRQRGKLRCAVSGTDCSAAYYLATPYTKR